MKTLIITILFLLSTLNCDELKWVDEQIEAIKPAREGIDDNIISQLKDPFIFLDIKKEKESTKQNNKKRKVTKKSNITRKKYRRTKIYKSTDLKFNLEAIINKTALINDKWYKIDQKIGTYILKEINKNHVVLIKGVKTIILSTDTQNKTLKFKNN
ncbi:MAG: hypothetical protein U9N02_07995 [Campylobacterota bacterium]|nr:hypothetical protein [Campylobacterota bacterium]